MAPEILAGTRRCRSPQAIPFIIRGFYSLISSLPDGLDGLDRPCNMPVSISIEKGIKIALAPRL